MDIAHTDSDDDFPCCSCTGWQDGDNDAYDQKKVDHIFETTFAILNSCRDTLQLDIEVFPRATKVLFRHGLCKARRYLTTLQKQIELRK